MTDEDRTWSVSVDGESQDLGRDAFFMKVIQPGFPNTMNFVLEVPEAKRQANRSFSEDGVDQMVEQIKTFLMARTLGTWDEGGSPPHEMSVVLRVGFKAVPIGTLRLGDNPWWHLVDEGQNPIEGSIRMEEP
jgi:hypothetical protein